MKKRDVIYAREGTRIVAKGTMHDPYRFDHERRIVDPNDYPWTHQVPVAWRKDFVPATITLGSEQTTVLESSGERLRRLQAAVENSNAGAKNIARMEGESSRAGHQFRSRNRTLIEARKMASDYRCQVCGFSFAERYGRMGERYIEAHHLRPISEGPRQTAFDDIALFCASCHAMIHATRPARPLHAIRVALRSTADR